MLRKKLLILFGTIGITIAFNGCNDLGKGSYQVFKGVPSVLRYESEIGKFTIATPDGSFIAPELTTFQDGDCIFADYKIDFDNQPYSYVIASEIVPTWIDQSRISESSNPGNLDDFDTPIYNSAIYSASPNYNGKVFFKIGLKKAQNQVAEYNLLYDVNELSDQYGTKNIYLKAKLTGGGDVLESAKKEEYFDYAFDLGALLFVAGRDTIINKGSSSEQKYKYLKVNMKYATTDEKGTPVYENSLVNNSLVLWLKR
ncbi:hypothetical protein FACS1894160_1660 [Bacteroidia bacterium]|nr:hypothetical protein FACS1894123_07340 [Bacteroidia bacterium]GHV08041.1 hypothetical protein FACS1894160_1660 [Bacteroidia bacterium]